MLVCTKENTFSEFLYLLRAQIELSKKRKKEDAPKIYVPINYVGYSETILQKNEITDLENYLWLFTKNWPLIFEVYDSRDNLSLQIVGETFVYEKVKSTYKVVLENTEDAIKFYKLLKALFILQTEIKDQYQFETKIDGNNGLSMYLAKVEITFDSLTNFIKNEFLLADYEIRQQNDKITEMEKKLTDIKENLKIKEEEYLQKQKEISTYLECKKTFFGKVKYFFKSDKKDKFQRPIRRVDEIRKEPKQGVDTKPIKAYIGDKTFYTIEDLVTIYSLHEKAEKYVKNLQLDLKSLELKLENVNSKVRNANQYIEEISKHKKSIFEFWKFANKDEKLALEVGDEKEDNKNNNTVERAFDYDMDFENLGKTADEIQRKKMSIEEMDSMYIAQTDLLEYVNMVRSNKVVKEILEKKLFELQAEFNDNRLVIDSEAFDIFGNIQGNDNKVKYIGSKSHRETEKSKFKIMNINKKIDVFDFTEKMQGIVNYLEGAMPKGESLYSMPLYRLVSISQNIDQENFAVYNINIENELKKFQDSSEGAYNLICLNYKEKQPLLYFTNTIFYDNNNQTLPVGMDLSTEVLVDQKRLRFSLVNKTKFRTNLYFTDSREDSVNPKSKDIFVYEYDVFMQDEPEENITQLDDSILADRDTAKLESLLEDDLEEVEMPKVNYVEQRYQEEFAFLRDKEETKEPERKFESVEEQMKQTYETIAEPPRRNRRMQKIEEKYEKEMEKQQRKQRKLQEKMMKRKKHER